MNNGLINFPKYISQKFEFYSQNFVRQVKGVITQFDELISKIQSNQINKIDELISINIFNSSDGHGQSASEVNGQFLHSQLLIDALLRMKSTKTDQDELISSCQKEY